MGKLVLTRRAGESVKLTEPNGREWLFTVRKINRYPFLGDRVATRLSAGPNFVADFTMCINSTREFAGGNVELRPHKRPDQAILAFDFPRDVAIVRTEIA